MAAASLVCPVLSWSRCPASASISHFSPNSACTEPIILRSKDIFSKVNCSVAASHDAGAGSEGVSGTVAENDTILDPQGKDLLQLAIRAASIGDYWEVADTHCGAFLPNLGFPMDMILRLDRVVAMLGGFSLPNGRKRMCLVAVDGQFYEGLNHDGFSMGDFLFLAGKGVEKSASHQRHHERISGILTVDTLAEFLPRRKATGLCRSGIAYISNVAVRQRMRRKGIAKRLVQAAELVAVHWGCRSIALHCDMNNPAALALYLGAGYKLIRTPIGAKWPQPKAMSSSEFCLMMKYLP